MTRKYQRKIPETITINKYLSTNINYQQISINNLLE